jgi:hypothetical protein
MWGLWFFPLVALSFLGGAAIGLVWLFAGRKKRLSSIASAIALPFGCAAMPVAGLALLMAIGALLQKSDTQLYEEIFGYRPMITEDRMLFDDFGSGRDRAIFMRAEPTDAEHKKLMVISGLVETGSTPDLFIARGEQHGFTLWLSANSIGPGHCQSVRILEAPGFRGWNEFHVAECLPGGTEFPAFENIRFVYVIASGRVE